MGEHAKSIYFHEIDQLVDLSPIRGKVITDYPLGDLSWFRTGGIAKALYLPADVADLAQFLALLPKKIAVTTFGLGSNSLVREGGVSGVVIRLGKAFGAIELSGDLIKVGAAVRDVKVANAAYQAGFGGLEFYHGIPGSIGGALRMNAGASRRETKDVLVSAKAVDLQGNIRELTNADFGFSYRNSAITDDLIFVEAVFKMIKRSQAQIADEMNQITASRKDTQPIGLRTGGSTFKNPPGLKSWCLIDGAGCRGLAIGGAQISRLHCNFMINRDQASAYDLELLGETIRARVFERFGLRLAWEIKRLGSFKQGRRVKPFLVEDLP